MQKRTSNWEGRIFYFSGGSSGTYKIISYSRGKWKRSIRVTYEILKSYGVNKSSRILILQPFSPWSIGQVFTEAGLLCGADVYPIGLYANEDIFQKIIADLQPTHLCGSIRNLIKWKKSINKKWVSDAFSKTTAFVAGEKFDLNTKRECAKLWNCKVVNIYGMAEFDTIAAEPPTDDILVLNPYLRYAIKIDECISKLKKGLIGELLIKESNDSEWYQSGDIIKVEELDFQNNIWKNSIAISFIQRASESITLSDGTEINLALIASIKERLPSIDKIQIVVHSSEKGEVISILHTQHSINQNISKEIKKVVTENIDILDAITHKVIVKISVRELPSTEHFKQTSRNKIPTLIRI